jgi:tellurite resistance protein TerB
VRAAELLGISRKNLWEKLRAHGIDDSDFDEPPRDERGSHGTTIAAMFGGPMKMSELEKRAAELRAELEVPKRNEVYTCAVEAGYIVAAADGHVGDDERATMVRAIDLLSQGAVIEWELDSLLDGCKERVSAEGSDARAVAVGRELKELGGAEAGLLFAALVAGASGGIDKKESAVLHAIGKAAGVAKGKVTALLKRVGAASSE